MAQGQDQLPPCLGQATASVTLVMSPRDGGVGGHTHEQTLLPSGEGVLRTLLRTGACRHPCLQEPGRGPCLQSGLWVPLA